MTQYVAMYGAVLSTVLLALRVPGMVRQIRGELERRRRMKATIRPLYSGRCTWGTPPKPKQEP